jgi:lysophospholipase L1-like esterase
MTELAKTNGIRVVLVSVLPAADYPWKRGIEPAPKIIALNAWLKQYAASAGAVYLDLHSAMDDGHGGMRPELSGDGVHPNAVGYALMARLTAPAIEQALKR